jgi:hypothetical protein
MIAGTLRKQKYTYLIISSKTFSEEIMRHFVFF